MAYDVRCKLYTKQTERDALGHPTGVPPLWRVVWCTATYSGGSRKTYAGRVVGEHQVVLTTHWREGIEQCRFVEFDGKRRAIVDVVPEGRRRLVHIITFTDDVGYGE
jgi:hypothetical protein